MPGQAVMANVVLFLLECACLVDAARKKRAKEERFGLYGSSDRGVSG